ncbi:MAG: hypothetical protein Marn2KO_32470 [Marinobacter nauticus]|uniref:hypothetical protein n=1 Tax=Marinobacter nauticus TaxID=2743 RepID=UPI001C5A0832|nr:hypothetical protein [Marinobacter nauticus]MBW3199145.1 hypothetical protein [Marinobacter nauticus]MBY6184555.1 hypothetical protein [Marinobacter nauticus]
MNTAAQTLDLFASAAAPGAFARIHNGVYLQFHHTGCRDFRNQEIEYFVSVPRGWRYGLPMVVPMDATEEEVFQYFLDNSLQYFNPIWLELGNIDHPEFPREYLEDMEVDA